MKNIVKIIFCLLITSNATSQSIRKNYLEMTPQEQIDYRTAIDYNLEDIMHFSNHHATHFHTPIHSTQQETGTGEWFTSWHRVFLLDLEFKIKNSVDTLSYKHLTIPYWNWLEDRNANNSNYWNNDFLALNNLPNFPITRNNPLPAITTNNFPSNDITALNGLFNTSLFYNGMSINVFTKKLELNYHNQVHSYIGGTMGQQTSPLDPVFYLHHAMVDYLWQIWEDKNIDFQSNFPTGNIGMPAYSNEMNPDNPDEVMYPCDIIANEQKDSRSISRPFSGDGCSEKRKWDVWYAYNGNVILDGTNGLPFICNDTEEPYEYRYTSAIAPGSSIIKGDIYIGDLKRQTNFSSIIELDNKGGFEIENNVICNFKAGNSIVFKPGFFAKSGSNVLAKIISSPNSNKNNTTKPKNNSKENFSQIDGLKMYPNPAKNNLYIETALNGDINVSIVNMLGKEVVNTKAVNNTVNVANLTSGIYIVKITEEGKTSTKKLIIE